MLEFLEEYEEINNSFDYIEREEKEEESLLNSNFLSPFNSNTNTFMDPDTISFSKQEDEKTRTYSNSNNNSLNEKKGKWKKEKKNTADFENNFNYKEYIREEMKKLDIEEIEPIVKKKIIQKIRNRMSAQRSRNRNKKRMVYLEEENLKLKQEVSELLILIKNLRNDNNYLKLTIREMESSNHSKNSVNNLKETFDNSENNFLSIEEDNKEIEKKIQSDKNSSTNYDITNDSDSQKSFISRENIKKKLQSQKSFLFLVCIIAVISLGSHDHKNEIVKVGGFLPLISHSLIPKKIEHLETPQHLYLEDKCKDYCKKQKNNKLQVYNQNKSVDIWEAERKLKDNLKPLFCMDSDRKSETKVFLFNKEILEILRNDQFYYVPDIIQIDSETTF
jgi:hypothetical protein